MLYFYFQFLQDLYSGKLHREFHYGPDKVTSEEPNKSQDDAKQEEMKLRESVNEINDPLTVFLAFAIIK